MPPFAKGSRFSQGWRAAGLMLHVTSLPGPYGVGDLGPEAVAFLDFLRRSGCRHWQILPLNPPSMGDSPYSAYSVFAGHELLVSPDLLVQDGWLTAEEAARARQAPSAKADFAKTIELKTALLDRAFEKAGAALTEREDFGRFDRQEAMWLHDYAFFRAMKADQDDRPWTRWPEPLKRRDDACLARHGTRLARPILRIKFGQFLFFEQLRRLKEQAAARDVKLVGDAAFYANHDSSDVWANQPLFVLDEQGEAGLMGGVPPDYFAENGQLWGNPVYDWAAAQNEKFAWWLSRLARNLALFDWVRLDHFRAFCGFWAVAAGETTARRGTWLPAPGAALLEAAGAPLNVVAEDLGMITPDVTELRRRFDLPGMRVLQFGFGPDQGTSLHAPFRIEPDNLVYAGTHDNNTTRGWFEQQLDEAARRRLADLAGHEVKADDAAWTLIRLAFLSPGALCLATVPDLLNLGAEARFNVPGTAWGNWTWRLTSLEALTPRLAERLANLAALSGRDDLTHPNLLTYG
ncbi:MAG: 4-alpha-glucanotransferase [Deltaproteobacteria bacterium]|nr:4-alpha-glucanotransferase [Deltaproteobacteria bacterium]